MDIDADSARVQFPPPLAFLGTLLLGVALSRLLGDPGLPLHRSTEHGIGALAAVLGLGTIFSAIGLFRGADTATRPWKRSTALITEGVYRWSRNPMYFGMAAAYVGIALWRDSLVALLLLIPLVLVIQREVIEREEAYLAATFGERYLNYKARVRRWI